MAIQTATSSYRDQTLPGLVRNLALQQPAAACLLDQYGAAVSFSTLGKELDKNTAALTRLGLARHDRAALLLPARESNLVTLLSVMSCCACAPLNPDVPYSELRNTLARIGASTLVLPDTGYDEVIDLASSIGINVIKVSGAHGNPFSLQLCAVAAGSAAKTGFEFAEQSPPPGSNDDALLLFTSGTSAAAKLVALTHAQLLMAAANISAVLELGPEDRQLSLMPLHHIHGLSTALASVLSGGGIICTKGYLDNEVPDRLAELGVTWYSASPSVHRQIMDRQSRAPGSVAVHSRLRFVRSASEKMPRDLLDRIETQLGVPVIEAYGMTEASPQIASNGLAPAERKAGSVGRAAGAEIRIIDNNGNDLSSGTIGEIVIKGDCVITRYADSDIDTRHAFINGWLRTGDEGYVDDEGFLFITGRLDDIINRGGDKISPARVEQALNNHPEIKESVVFRVPDKQLGQEVSAAIVPARGAGPGYCDTTQHLEYQKLLAGVQRDLGKQLPWAEVPKSFYVVDRLALGPSGKRSRAAPQQYHALIVPDPGHGHHSQGRPSPLSGTESFLAGLWRDLLRCETVTLDDNFFRLGGDSLAAKQVLAKIDETFGIALPYSCIVEHPSISGLARLIGAGLSDRAVSGAKATAGNAQRGAMVQGAGQDDAPGPAAGLDLSDVQKQIWFMHHNDTGAAYHMSASLYLFGELDVGTLKDTLRELVRRHESLRIGIRNENGIPRQFARDAGETRLELVDLTEVPRARRKTAVRRLASATYNEPFDLSRDPLVRFKLVQVDDNEHLLLITMHHIISDGWSVSLLYRDLSSIYNSIHEGRDIVDSTAPPGFMSYIRSLKPDTHGKAGSMGYWQNKLQDCPAACRFPPDHLVPKRRSYAGAMIRSQIDEPLYDQIQFAARRHDVTTYVFLLAAFSALLYRYNRQSDSIIGTAVAGRDTPSSKDTTGCFANTVVLRNPVSGETTFPQHLRAVAREVQETIDHADVSLLQMIHGSDVERQQGSNPIFQTMFVLQDFPGSPLGSISGETVKGCLSRSIMGPADVLVEQGFDIGQGLHAVPWQHEISSAKFDLTLYLRPGSRGLFLGWQFRTCLYENESVRRIAVHFVEFVEQLVNDPAQAIDSYALSWYGLPGPEHSLPAAGVAPSMRADGFLAQFRQQVERNPEAIAVTASMRHWSYAELDQVAGKVARHLEDLGVKPGSVVGVHLSRRIELFAVVIGIWKAGAVYLPCDPGYPAERVRYMLEDSNAEYVIVEQWVAENYQSGPRARPHCVDLGSAWSRIIDLESDDLEPGIPPDSTAYIIYTSGSSGRPQKVTVTHGNLGYYGRAMQEALGMGAWDRYLHTASISFSSSIRQFVLPLVSGGTIVVADVADTRDPDRLCRLVCAQDITILDLVPSHWSIVVSFLESSRGKQLTQWRDAPLRLALSASEPFATAMYSRLRACLGGDAKVVNMYGQTETTGIVTMYEISDHDPSRPTIPVGRPLPGTEICILDRRHQRVPIGVIGEIHVASPAIARHDLQIRGKHYYRTGDLARYLHDGNIEFIGRSDQQIKIKGHRVNPAEIEGYIRMCPGVKDAVVEAVDAPSSIAGGKVTPIRDTGAAGPWLTAFVIFGEQSNNASSTVRYKNVRSKLREWLPGYMVPTRFVELAAFPALPNGKVDRVALKRQGRAQSGIVTSTYNGHSSRGRRYTPTEELCAAIWRHVLRVDAIDRDDNFFDLGGDSLLSIEFVEQARGAYLDVSLEDLFQHQTLSDLARCIEQKDPAGARRAGPVETEPGTGAVPVRVTAESLRQFSVEALTKAGLSADIAEIVTAVQLEASLRSQPTHNIASIPRYARRIESGLINARPELRVIQEGPLSAVVSGDNGPGQWVAVQAMQLAIEKAQHQGIGMVTVRESNHFGAAGHYPWLASQHGLIGLCTTNGPVILAPTGGLTATLGNNPLAVGIPSQNHAPVLLDITMSVAPRGKIGVTLEEGQPLPEGWIFDEQGRPSTNLADLAAGLGVPIGGHKGYGLALIMEILAGVLSGSGFGLDHKREQIRQNAEAPDIGHFFMVVDPGLFMAVDQFQARVDALIQQVKSARRVEGVDEILVPGEKELHAREASLVHGVRLQESEYKKLLRLAKEMELQSTLIRV